MAAVSRTRTKAGTTPRLAVLLVVAALAARAHAQAPTSSPTAPTPQQGARTVDTWARIGDLTTLHGVQENTLTGIGIVVGLAATGSGDKATRQALANFIRRRGLNISDADLTTGSSALVSVTAMLPPFAKEGEPLDVSVQSLGDATSLFGGELILTELKGPDDLVYVTAAGKVSLGGGFSVSSGKAGGGNARVQRNHTTAGKITNGGIVVREVQDPSRYLSEDGSVQLRLRSPSEANAVAIATLVESHLGATGVKAQALDRYLVRIKLPKEQQSEQAAMRVLALLHDQKVRVANPNTVVISETTGFVLAGGAVQISPCVLALSDLTISVVNEEEVSQPQPMAYVGETVRSNRTRIDVTTSNGEPKQLQGGVTVGELLSNLKALELGPRQLIEVFQQLHSAGYLHAELLIR
jgi:flagellar P-ring protein precursor FlgI